jgi:L-asparaginase
MNSKHIALIYTGGTVGMAKTAQGYAPMPDFTGTLAALLQPMAGALPGYTLHAYATPIDSTNATPQDWHHIGSDIAARYQEADGFVILHGTDTMAYTASALSFMLQGLRKAVIVTGSQIPLGEARSDALQNVVTALQLAASDELNEVAIYFNQRLLRGNRATKISASRMQAFDSPNYPWLVEVQIAPQWNDAALLPRAAVENFETPAYANGRILPLRFVPGLPVSAVQAMLDLDPQALILETYGAGNVPDHDPALLALLKRAHAQGVMLVACSQSLHGAVTLGTYATSAALVSAGVIGAKDMTFEAVFTKLHHLFALGLSPEQVRATFQKNLSGEFTD